MPMHGLMGTEPLVPRGIQQSPTQQGPGIPISGAPPMDLLGTGGPPPPSMPPTGAPPIDGGGGVPPSLPPGMEQQMPGVDEVPGANPMQPDTPPLTPEAEQVIQGIMSGDPEAINIVAQLMAMVAGGQEEVLPDNPLI